MIGPPVIAPPNVVVGAVLVSVIVGEATGLVTVPVQKEPKGQQATCPRLSSVHWLF